MQRAREYAKAKLTTHASRKRTMKENIQKGDTPKADIPNEKYSKSKTMSRKSTASASKP